ncbi:hypothetical protein TVAG_120330 [Trichomonas vaginalis G3]|uniref:Uncharacterized protein n=1 Tax=Trichomonas vaginalis (strain ATCC PRA-98 / G3) TaxID=412133 RepID=A2D7H8_TRIV3|nr:hypothetical protein TVAGG3_0993360 [Trichomonas vaginalis G3]EAY23695.1 hypothetical protein TVAG_120330 [Trichomonas vaginalis G3]KAI5490190.1 hypothetical protein TVAGG3_0993360 [Trichomonas vaginalis G3]|eukprot:XP_001276943.1 hypothetical protein [Trichomonas vaginalis G3]
MIGDPSVLNKITTRLSRERTPRRSSSVVRRNSTNIDYGYIETSTGELVRLVQETKDESYLGPGAYNPYPDKPSGRQTSISRNCIRSPLVTDPFPSSPASYPYKPSETRLKHTLHVTEDYPLDPTPLSGELSHEEWTNRKKPILPKQRCPNIDFQPVEGSSEFESKTGKELWIQETTFHAPSPVMHTPDLRFSTEQAEKSGIFLSGTERFKVIDPVSPPSTTYTMPEIFGISNAKKIYPPSKKIDRSLFDNYHVPDPGVYGPPVVEYVKTKKNSMSIVPRFPDIELTPGPCDYRPKQANSRPSTSIQEVRNHRDEWIKKTASPNLISYVGVETKTKNGSYIARAGRKGLEQKLEDHPYEFRTMHSSFIKPSFNSHYSNVKAKQKKRK